MLPYNGIEIFSLVSFSVIFILGSIGNLLVIYVYGFTTRRRFVKFEKLMLMLGIFDFIASVTNPAFYIYQIASHDVWHLGELPCKVIPALGPIFTGLSLGMILIMAVDRDRAVSTPFKTQFNLCTVYKAVALTIALCILVTSPYMYHLTYGTFEGELYCYIDSDAAYDKIVITIFLTSDFAFLVIFVTTTVRLFWTLKSKPKGGESCPRKMRNSQKRETNRILKIILAMGIMFVVCVFPRDLLILSFSIRRLFPPEIPYESAKDLNYVLKVLHTANSCVNVILYSLINKKFRHEIFHVMMKSKRFRHSYYTSRKWSERDTIIEKESQWEQTTDRNDNKKWHKESLLKNDVALLQNNETVN